MCIKLVLFLALNLFLMAAAVAANKYEKIVIKLSPELKGRIEADLGLRNGTLITRTFKTLKLRHLKPGVNVIPLNGTPTIRSIKASFRLISDLNLNNGKTKEAKVEAILRAGKALKSEVIKVPGPLKLQGITDITCSNVIITSAQGKTFEIDLSKLKHLGSCTGNFFSRLVPEGVGHRKVTDDYSNLFSMEDDIRMGESFVQKYVTGNGDRILPADHPTTVYLQKKMELLAKNSDLPELKPVVYVINADVLSAFALPGGHVFVFRGLIAKSPSEAALMGLLGHEWAHVAARHGTLAISQVMREMRGNLGFGLMAGSADLLSDEEIKQKLLQMLSRGTYLGNQFRDMNKGRMKEREADRLGPHYAILSGYHPRGIGDMLDLFKSDDGRTITLEKYLGFRPEYDDRIELNHIFTALFYPDRDFITTTVSYVEAQNALGSVRPPSESETELIAGEFVNALQENQEKVLLEKILKDIRNP